MKVLDREKKIKDILPIEDGGYPEIKAKADLDNYVEEPLLEICRKLYDLNIQTIMSSANRGDIGNFAGIDIVYGTLSQENKETMKLLSRNFPEKFSMSENCRGIKMDIITVNMPITSPDTTAGEISDYFLDSLKSLKMQDIVYGVCPKEELKAKAAKVAGCQEEDLTEDIFKEVLEIMEYEIEQDGKCYTKEAFRRHQLYVDSKLQEDKISENERKF